MLQDCLLILHILTQIMTFNYFAIVLLHIAKLTIVCIDFASTTVHFITLYKAFLTILISVNVCTILAETISMFHIVRTNTNLTQQNMHELHEIA